MKKIVSAAVVAIMLGQSVRAQEPGASFPENQVVVPHKVEVTFSKTLHILFPAAVRYIDLGSTDIIAGIVDGAENVVRIKAAVKGFEGETNFSVITSDGSFYSFDARYSENPDQLNIEMEDWLRKDPYSDFVNDRMYIRLKELGGETPLIVNRIMYSIHKRNARDVRGIRSRKFGMDVAIRGIYINADLMYFHLSMKNSSHVSFDIDNIRFKIVDRRVAKRTAVQETYIEPVSVFNDVVRVDGKSTERNVYAFPKITMPDDKVLIMEVFEYKGGRHQTLKIRNGDLVGAKTVKELNIQ